MTTFLYYSNLAKPDAMLNPIRARLIDQARRMGASVVGVVPRPVDEPHFDLTVQHGPGRMPEGIFNAILAGLKAIPAGVVYLCEDDCLYHDCHFSQPGACGPHFFYDLAMVHLCPAGFFERHNRMAIALSHAWGEVNVIRAAMVRKIAEIEAGTFTCYEPAGSVGYLTNHMRTPFASIDIRHSANNTWKRGEADTLFQNEPGWPAAAELVKEYGIT